MSGLYPDHDCSFCGIARSIADAVADGRESWGTPHYMPAVATLDDAVKARRGIFRGRYCKKNTARHGDLSVMVNFRHPDGAYDNTPGVDENGQYTLVVRVVPRSVGRQAVIQQVREGKQLTYNVHAKRAIGPQ